MRNIILLGAGHIGQAIARRLHGSGDYRLLAADREAAALQPLEALGIAARQADFSDAAALRTLLAGGDAVINALPWHMAIAVAEAARAAGVHYFDLTEDVQATRRIMQLAADADSAFMPQCGLAPGFVGIAAHHLAQDFDDIREIKMRVGALPEFPTNEIKYNLTWSVDGLVNEYCHPCEAIRDGALHEAQPLEGLEHFSLDGVEYEAFNTSGGLGTLCATLAGRAANLDYKSVRYPGHRDRLRFLLEELRLKERPALLKDILRHAVPATMQDVVLVFVTVSGTRNGQYQQRVFSRKVFAADHGGVPESAIQITTAAGVCAAVDLFFAGRLPQRGFLRQEQLALPEFLANRFGRAYAAPEGDGRRRYTVAIDDTGAPHDHPRTESGRRLAA
ncbi:saccharopine dehydrogenase C-terminal domain-containing protein [Herbaspirillum sp. WKF16]|jgi:saccharopine dehydrogenase-like NADP-dependent oxidoreductase|uniref:saccharopine dehydrogenase family protein n=1 Tax=Herbaspirillum sp. WKF16 TaxID=3028312 RepID=UPI0023A9BC1C|nr:saccharopine dehydrogenase C-terminal domain-containing protein [Herbaspirillum sp. WKF16]WDZ96131.1 saccharopine dehydrogenase C-terminal domain-containing protein [Herbaspirillum sp. WKF16]